MIDLVPLNLTVDVDGEKVVLHCEGENTGKAIGQIAFFTEIFPNSIKKEYVKDLIQQACWNPPPTNNLTDEDLRRLILVGREMSNCDLSEIAPNAPDEFKLNLARWQVISTAVLEYMRHSDVGLPKVDFEDIPESKCIYIDYKDINGCDVHRRIPKVIIRSARGSAIAIATRRSRECNPNDISEAISALLKQLVLHKVVDRLEYQCNIVKCVMIASFMCMNDKTISMVSIPHEDLHPDEVVPIMDSLVSMLEAFSSVIEEVD